MNLIYNIPHRKYFILDIKSKNFAKPGGYKTPVMVVSTIDETRNFIKKILYFC